MLDDNFEWKHIEQQIREEENYGQVSDPSMINDPN